MIYPTNPHDVYEGMHEALRKYGVKAYAELVTGDTVVAGRIMWLTDGAACVGSVTVRHLEVRGFAASGTAPTLLTVNTARLSIVDRARKEADELGMSPAEAGAYIEDAINAADAAALDAERESEDDVDLLIDASRDMLTVERVRAMHFDLAGATVPGSCVTPWHEARGALTSLMLALAKANDRDDMPTVEGR